eukprot:13544556-Ditylum_brightwellii.AAC.1
MYYILLDAFSSYHQIRMDAQSTIKTAFTGPYRRKYMYKVMPFDLVNAPSIFVIMIYDFKDDWDGRAQENGVNIGDDNGCKIIIDDTFIYVTDYRQGFKYLDAILEISKTYNISWKLHKCHFFPKEVEFVGHDVAIEGNCPAKSKSLLLQTWP